MEAAAERMEAQLKQWSLKIDRLTARTQRAGVQVGFDALVHIDELKALHAMAQSRLVEFMAGAAGDTERTRLKAELRSAWDELEAAFKNPIP